MKKNTLLMVAVALLVLPLGATVQATESVPATDGELVLEPAMTKGLMEAELHPNLTPQGQAMASCTEGAIDRIPTGICCPSQGELHEVNVCENGQWVFKDFRCLGGC